MDGAFAQIRDRIAALYGARPERVRLAVEIGLAALLAVQVARLGWMYVAPTPDVAPAPPAAPTRAADLNVFKRFDPFFREATGGAEAAPVAAGGLQLFGVSWDGGSGGMAILSRSDGTQGAFVVGEEIEPGVTLRAVGPGYADIDRGGASQRLTLAEPGEAPPPAPPAPPSSAPAPADATPTAAPVVVDPGALMREAVFRPRLQGLRMNGVSVSAKDGGAALAAAGLRDGDVVLAVNGRKLDGPQALAGLRAQLASSASAQLQIERDGQAQSLTVRTR